MLQRIREVCDAQSFVLGKNVKALEEEIAGFCNARYAVGVASGSDAILLALMASGVGPGDRVITTPYTFFATASAIVRLGAIPVFIDIDPATYNIDPHGIEEYLKKASRRGTVARSLKAIIPVHLFGQCAAMKPITTLAKTYGLKVVERRPIPVFVRADTRDCREYRAWRYGGRSRYPRWADVLKS